MSDRTPFVVWLRVRLGVTRTARCALALCANAFLETQLFRSNTSPVARRLVAALQFSTTDSRDIHAKRASTWGSGRASRRTLRNSIGPHFDIQFGHCGRGLSTTRFATVLWATRLFAASLLCANTAFAQATIKIDPSPGLPGQVITISGLTCADAKAPASAVVGQSELALAAGKEVNTYQGDTKALQAGTYRVTLRCGNANVAQVPLRVLPTEPPSRAARNLCGQFEPA